MANLYRFFWTDNKAAVNGKEHFYIGNIEARSEYDAIIEFMDFQGLIDKDNEDLVNLLDIMRNMSNPWDLLTDVKLGASGEPVVFWIKKDNELIYDSGITKAEWLGDDDNDSWINFDEDF